MDGDDEEISIIDKDGKAVFGPQPPKRATESTADTGTRPDVNAKLDVEIKQYKKLMHREKVSQK